MCGRQRLRVHDPLVEWDRHVDLMGAWQGKTDSRVSCYRTMNALS